MVSISHIVKISKGVCPLYPLFTGGEVFLLILFLSLVLFPIYFLKSDFYVFILLYYYRE